MKLTVIYGNLGADESTYTQAVIDLANIKAAPRDLQEFACDAINNPFLQQVGAGGTSNNGELLTKVIGVES